MIEQKGIVFLFLRPSFIRKGREKGNKITKVVVKKTMPFWSIQLRTPSFAYTKYLLTQSFQECDLS